MEIRGKIKLIRDTNAVSEKFKKREFVVTVEGDKPEYSEHIQIEFIQDKCSLLDSYAVGQIVTVSINLKGREWTKDGVTRYFNTLQAWKISGVGGEAVSSGHPVAQESPVMDDDLPF
jgi:hypothetical protein